MFLIGKVDKAYIKKRKTALKLTYFLYIIISSVFLIGCAPNITQKSDYLEIAKKHIAKSRWEAAYRFLEDIPKNEVNEAKVLIKKHSNIVRYGLKTFLPSALLSSVSRFGIVKSYDIELKRLSYLKRFATKKQYEIAANNVLGYYDESEIQNAIRNEVDDINRIEYGLIIDVQMQDNSNYNIGLGAGIGSAYASSKYIDRAFSGKNWSYSATKHNSAALLGSIVGHLIEGESDIDYHVRYSIRIKNNDNIFIGSHQISRFFIPKGTCVKIKRRVFIEIANQKKCY